MQLKCKSKAKENDWSLGLLSLLENDSSPKQPPNHSQSKRQTVMIALGVMTLSHQVLLWSLKLSVFINLLFRNWMWQVNDDWETSCVNHKSVARERTLHNIPLWLLKDPLWSPHWLIQMPRVTSPQSCEQLYRWLRCARLGAVFY